MSGFGICESSICFCSVCSTELPPKKSRYPAGREGSWEILLAEKGGSKPGREGDSCTHDPCQVAPGPCVELSWVRATCGWKSPTCPGDMRAISACLCAALTQTIRSRGNSCGLTGGMILSHREPKNHPLAPLRWGQEKADSKIHTSEEGMYFPNHRDKGEEIKGFQ